MPSSNLKGILSMLIAVFAFSAMDATMKYLGQSYAPLQVTSLRGFASLPFLLLPVVWSGRWQELKPVRWPYHIARGVLAIGLLSLFIYSLKTLSLASAYAIFLCAPLLITALSVPFFGEKVDAPRWAAIVVGLIGVLIIVRPNASDVVTIGALAALASALCYSCSSLLIRAASRTETTLGMTVSFVFIIAIGAGAMALPEWTAVQLSHWPFIVLLGVTGAVGQYFMVEAFRMAPVSVVAPFDYTQLIWGGMIDWFFWQTLPDSRMLLGGATVVASGMFLIYRERTTSAKQN
jgi:drug/metabolite transporter (DMT)-like permease